MTNMTTSMGYSNGLPKNCDMSDSRDSTPSPQPAKIRRLSSPKAAAISPASNNNNTVAGLPRPPLLIPAGIHLYQQMSPSATSTSTLPGAAFQQAVRQRLDEILTGTDLMPSSLTIDGKTRQLCNYYSTLIPEDRTAFLKILAMEYCVDHSHILQLAQNLSAAQERGAGVLLRMEERLRHSLVPRYQYLFTKISHQENGVKFLVDLRTDLLAILQSKSADHDNPYLYSLNTCLRDLLSLWFSVGFFKLERITWESPCDILQKISEYEAVHPIRNWTDLKRRVGSYRRCFVFTHHSMPREPVVVLHTALTNEISSSIQSIVSRSNVKVDGRNSNSESSFHFGDKEDATSVSTAIFYSITSTQRGLTGVESGNYLIKSVVKELQSEFPSMHQFSSLSPIPGFREWLFGEINTYLHHKGGEDREQLLFTETELSQLRVTLQTPSGSIFESLKKVLANNSWIANDHLTSLLKEPLMRLCARYLYVEKRRGFAYNPVANFHLRNGAVMWRLNWLADVSARGLGASCGMMINYRYFLEQTENNSKTYMETQQILASEQILELVQLLPRPRRLSLDSTTSSCSNSTA